ncbi:MAG: GNAT family N-acetyltransferase [Candidatus Aenigmarchaeota archaeon]|nr:GNAT family N-acetyltransferase [Candidatus Aenigmarchaeota archaeon]
MNKSDLLALAEIYVDTYTKINIGEQWNIDTAKKLISYWLEKQPDLAFVAEYDKKIVGAFVAGIKPWWDGNHLADGEIFIHPDFQKHGIGSELLKTMFKTALEKYNAVSYDAITYNNYEFPLNWYKSLSIIPEKNLVVITGNIKSILSKLKNN